MKTFFKKHRYELLTLLIIVLVGTGLSFGFDSFAKPHGHADKYPEFLMASSLIALYIIPFVLLTNYLRRRFNISKQVYALSWVFAMTIPANIGSWGNTFLSLILLSLKLPKSLLDDWGASLTAPFAEEFAKGLAVLLLVLFIRQVSLKGSLVFGMIAGMGFQIREDITYVYQTIFLNNKSGFSTIFERLASADRTHWVYTGILAVGLIALVFHTKAISKKRALFFLIAPVAIHFAWNSPLDFTGIEVIYGVISWFILFSAFKTVDQLSQEEDSISLK